jgi:hypothetical protein
VALTGGGSERGKLANDDHISFGISLASMMIFGSGRGKMCGGCLATEPDQAKAGRNGSVESNVQSSMR